MNKTQRNLNENKIIKVFIASPGDVSTERKNVDKIIKELNDVFAYSFNISIAPYRWEVNAVPGAGPAQGVIFEQTDSNDWDVFIGILWCRFGTNTGLNDQNETGTEAEFKSAYKTWKETGKPRIMLYRCMRQVPSTVDTEQLGAVQKFFSNCEATGSHPGLCKTYKSHDEFKKLILTDLLQHVLTTKLFRIDLSETDSLHAQENDLLQSLHDIGLDQVTKTLVNTEFEPNACMDSVRKKLWFCGISGNKWIGTEEGYNRFRIMLDRVSDNNGEVHFLLISPNSREFQDMIKKQNGNAHIEVYRKWKQLDSDYPCLKIKCYKKLPVFRIQLIDDRIMTLTKYHYQSDEYEKYRNGWDSPHIVFNSQAPFSFFSVFEKYYITEWEKGTKIRSINF